MTSLIAAVTLTSRHARDSKPTLLFYLLRSLVTLAGLVGLFLLAGL
jgi:hypothetical protein